MFWQFCLCFKLVTCINANVLFIYVYIHNSTLVRMWMLMYVWIVQGGAAEEVKCSYILPLSHRVNCARDYILLFSHAYIEWYNDIWHCLTFFNYPSLDMEVRFILNLVWALNLITLQRTILSPYRTLTGSPLCLRMSFATGHQQPQCWPRI